MTESNWITIILFGLVNIMAVGVAWGTLRSEVKELRRVVCNGLSTNVQDIYIKVNSMSTKVAVIEATMNERRRHARHDDEDAA